MATICLDYDLSQTGFLDYVWPSFLENYASHAKRFVNRTSIYLTEINIFSALALLGDRSECGS